ncbi:cysteine dioxygenase [Metabacillus endolithicus]|uniref:Cysteine dioxygenase n=1 Tax=Metabacillus endolithicus TaxID=1535204 RepID=A0ABW5C0C2_9BACI|nr:cysteine dioxygenase family protein [Metabacillus endolithicus]UPG64045.1 cysteine dioxygenase family protein [Metabacillus endolithicus]
MDYKDRIHEILGNLENTSSDALKLAMEELAIQPEELEPILKTEDDKPYYRKLLFKNERVELLVMNWSQIECAPHDHGSSFGWIQVINGTAKNTVYKVDGTKLPIELFTEFQENGKMFFAPEKGVHKMSVLNKSKLVTLHLYSPPITGMKVYDLNKCAACIVSDDCGAWWPEEQRQKVKEIQLEKN